MALLIIAAALALGAVSLASAQNNPPAVTPPPASTATSPTVECPNPVSQDLVMPPEIVSDKGVLKGTVILTQEDQRMPTSDDGGATQMTCAPQLVRVFRGDGLPPAPPAQPEAPGLIDPMPGPTLRARVGDIVQLRFVNEVDPNRFDKDLDIDACVRVVGKGGSTIYPGATDRFPDCLHASSTANIHYHGTHTNPNSTGDNVFLQVRPLPRDKQGEFTTTPAAAMVGFEQFFSQCAAQLKNPLASWPKLWADIKPSPWLDKQEELLKAYQAKQKALHEGYPDQYPEQPLWDRDVRDEHQAWPVYYIGAVPYCFALPAYTEPTWPPPRGSASPIMGQAPGTHWYHAHKHGSTAINVANGMTGAFIIEGKYDDDLTDSYGDYVLKDGKSWNARSQPVLVLNQLGTTPNLLTRIAGPSSSPNSPRTKKVADFEVNGRIRPIAHMQPGEVQLWRILNTSGRSAAYFMAPPKGFHWRQLAQDGVQFATNNYVHSEDKPFYLAPANRVDLLVRAPMTQVDPKDANILVQIVVARGEVKPTPAKPTQDDPAPGVALMSIAVSGDPVTQDGKPAQMEFLGKAPNQPGFLADITDQELEASGNVKRTFTFNSESPGSAYQHTINNCQFDDTRPECEHADRVPVTLNRAEEWTIKNTTSTNGPGLIDHPFHIHINPFQITEVFDPNENLTNLKTGELLKDLVDGKTQPVPRYVTDESQKSNKKEIAAQQCVLKPDNPSTWSVTGACGRAKTTPSTPDHLIWWDVFAMPSGRDSGLKEKVVYEGKEVERPIIIPGYFKMRSRFVDYPGSYVFHCHILIHEDRGMMFTVEVTPLDIENHHH
jgi:FtsP/CotA-like multicopper oxidase with cupredoxin domain